MTERGNMPPFAKGGCPSSQTGAGGVGFKSIGDTNMCRCATIEIESPSRLAATAPFRKGGLWRVRRQPSARLAADAIPGPASKPVRQWRGCGNSGLPFSAAGSGSPQFPFAKGAIYHTSRFAFSARAPAAARGLFCRFFLLFPNAYGTIFR